MPATIIMAVDLREANCDENLLCFVPGDEICVSDPVTFEITADDFPFGLPGQFLFTLPITSASETLIVRRGFISASLATK